MVNGISRTMVKQNKKMAQQGGDYAEFSDQTKNLFDLMAEMKKIFVEWIETGKKPAEFKEIIDGTHPLVQNMNEANMFDFDDDDGEKDFDLDDLSPEELAEIMALFGVMNQRSAKSKPKNRRR